MKLWKPGQETLWALERSWEFSLLATEKPVEVATRSVTGSSSPLCKMTWSPPGERDGRGENRRERDRESETERERGHFFWSCITVKSQYSSKTADLFQTVNINFYQISEHSTRFSSLLLDSPRQLHVGKVRSHARLS